MTLPPAEEAGERRANSHNVLDVAFDSELGKSKGLFCMPHHVHKASIPGSLNGLILEPHLGDDDGRVYFLRRGTFFLGKIDDTDAFWNACPQVDEKILETSLRECSDCNKFAQVSPQQDADILSLATYPHQASTLGTLASKHSMAPHDPTRTLSPRQSRVVGALLGLHAGDSLGATLEFESHAAIASRYPNGLRQMVGGGPFGWPAGHATDDTDMARGVLLAYRDAKPGEDVARLAGDNFLKWRHGEWPGRTPGSWPVDIGLATATGLDRYCESGDPDRAGAGEGSAGNGSLMRCLPTGLFQPDGEKLIEESVRISGVTHDDRRCTVSCAAYNAIVAELINGTPADDAVRAGEAVAARLENGHDGLVHAAMATGRRVRVAGMAQHGPPPEMGGRCSGYVLETLAVAVAAVLDDRGLEDVLVDVVRIGRDTDTNAAVAGGLLGARDGEDAIPWAWREKLQFGDEFREIALALTK
ncbi:ADP-ribosyl-[dinitrogen reductase] glycohydrolase [Tolypocladium paradoxum]|uniref:ADP-ribosylhydrolase ARH3 n=1 Tax=Tolypocladium paradoxum TaxID=94208 RepID=A0A2S4KN11_9HYPO|nr:ADP-ribosyl-[dinitrogen reductase] glycohydrolase [Tolypocladium paradoxum]